MSASKPSEQTSPLIRALKEVLGARDGDEVPDQAKARARAEELIGELETCLGTVEAITARPQALRIQDISTVLPGEPPQQLEDREHRAAKPVPPQPPIVEMPTFVPADPEGGIGQQPHSASDCLQRRHGDSPGPDSAMFGPYELLEKIGRGGMGVVYKARQRTLNRVVALKRIRAGEDAPDEDLKRFQLEAEAAGKLDHPNIVQVYEFGEVAGERFFSMAYIDGESLAAKVAQDGPIPTRRAARYLKSVAEAVAYAHENGVIHRDLKPANILLDQNDEPHITDFGLAKKLDEDSNLTATGAVMGTPTYMAPEQAEGKTRDIGPLSDVYSLGAVLYCLVVGRPPFQAANMVETMKQVLDEEPVPPRQLNRSIERDLERICLKCLAKEPHRRYLSARALAEDLGRFLSGAPVHARPVSGVARLWRWCRRNPLLAGVSATAVALLVLGSVVSTFFAFAEKTRAREARANADEADHHFRLAREAVDNLYSRVSEELLLNRPGMQRVRHDLLAEAQRYYQGFLAHRSHDATVREDLALAQFRVGLITEELDSPAAALPALQRASQLQELLLQEQPAGLTRLQALADTRNAIGRVQHRLKRPDEATAAFKEAARLREKLVAAVPENHEYSRVLANSLMNIGLVEQGQSRFEAAREWYEKAQSLRRDVAKKAEPSAKLRRDLASGHYNLATLLLALAEKTGEGESVESARQNLTAAIENFELLRQHTPDDLDSRHRLGICYRMLGDTEKILERLPEAIKRYRQAGSVFEQLVKQNPAVPDYRVDWAATFIGLAELYDAQNAAELTLESFQQAAQLLEPLVEAHAENARYRRDYAVVLRSVAMIQLDTGEQQKALENLRTAAQHFNILVERFPNEKSFTAELRKTEEVLATSRSGRERGN